MYQFFESCGCTIFLEEQKVGINWTYVEDGVVRNTITENHVAVIAVIYTEVLIRVNPKLLFPNKNQKEG